MPHMSQVRVCRRRGRTGWWIAWRDRYHRACEPDCKAQNRWGYHRVRAGESKEEAENMAQWVRDRLHPWNVSAHGVEWSQFVAQYMLAIANRSDAHRTIAERVLTRFTEKLAPVNSAAVLPVHVDQYLAELTTLSGEPASMSERAKHWRYLHSLFEFGLAPERRYVVLNPVMQRARPWTEEKIVRAPRWPDVLELLRATERIACNDAQGLYLLVLLAAITALRANDVLALLVGDFEAASAESPVALWWARNRKGRRVKVCGIPRAVEKLVIRRLGDLPEGHGRFFFWPSFPHNAWARLVDEAKVGGLQFQALRRAGGALAATSAVRRAGQRQLQHTSQTVYRRHYEDIELEAVAVAQSLVIPRLPPLPKFRLGAVDRKGRMRAVGGPTRDDVGSSNGLSLDDADRVEDQGLGDPIDKVSR